jgi:hypothetical protein
MCEIKGRGHQATGAKETKTAASPMNTTSPASQNVIELGRRFDGPIGISM